MKHTYTLEKASNGYVLVWTRHNGITETYVFTDLAQVVARLETLARLLCNSNPNN